MQFSIKNLMFIILCGWVIILTIGINHYWDKLKVNEIKLAQLQSAYERNMEMLGSFQEKNAELSAKLLKINLQAQQRKQQLNEVLERENNKNWADEPVPVDVIRLFKQRTEAR